MNEFHNERMNFRMDKWMKWLFGDCIDHVVVDRVKFQEMFKRETTQAANKKTSDLLNRVDNVIEKLKSDFKNEWIQNVQILKETLQRSILTLEEQLKYEFPREWIFCDKNMWDSLVTIQNLCVNLKNDTRKRERCSQTWRCIWGYTQWIQKNNQQLLWEHGRSTSISWWWRRSQKNTTRSPKCAQYIKHWKRQQQQQ